MEVTLTYLFEYTWTKSLSFHRFSISYLSTIHIICCIFTSYSHGTKVSGLIAAEADNTECTIGVAYNSTLIGKTLYSSILKDFLKYILPLQ